MTSRAVTYGACELQRNAHRFWMFGFILSLALHLSMVGSYYLAGVSRLPGIEPRPAPPVGGLRPVGGTALLPGIGPLLHAPGIAATGKKGTPVPVKGVTNAVTPTQGELASGVEPVGSGAGEEGATGEVTIPPEEESEPPIFRPVQIEPRVVLSVAPEYPRLAVEAGMEGKVWVKIWVDGSGRPRKAVVIKGDAEIFNEAALAAAMKFVFTPAIMNDRPVSVWVAIPFSFKLR